MKWKRHYFRLVIVCPDWVGDSMQIFMSNCHVKNVNHATWGLQQPLVPVGWVPWSREAATFSGDWSRALRAHPRAPHPTQLCDHLVHIKQPWHGQDYALWSSSSFLHRNHWVAGTYREYRSLKAELEALKQEARLRRTFGANLKSFTPWNSDLIPLLGLLQPVAEPATEPDAPA